MKLINTIINRHLLIKSNHNNKCVNTAISTCNILLHSQYLISRSLHHRSSYFSTASSQPSIFNSTNVNNNPNNSAFEQQLPSQSSSNPKSNGNQTSDTSSSCSYHTRGTDHSLIDRMIRVDHAGEYGAQCIYEGQLSILQNDPNYGPLIRHMKEQETEHLDALNQLIPERRVRPTILLPIWHVAGYGLGVLSALGGVKSAMACTVAVEEVITEHYNDQLRTLHEPGFEKEASLRKLIQKHRDDEEEHRDIGLEHDAINAPFYSLLSNVVKTGCKTAIWISERI